MVAAGRAHLCAGMGDGSVSCIGSDEFGELADGMPGGESDTAVLISGVSNPVRLVAGGHHTCALNNAGDVQCWGFNDHGQLGGSGSQVVTVVAAQGARRLAAGDSHTCALLDDGSGLCWGDNYKGQLGNGDNTDSTDPVVVSGLVGAKEIAAGYDHTCAVLEGGSVQCWGADGFGELGDGNSSTISYTPVTVSGLSDAVAIAASHASTCALRLGGAVSCWGRFLDESGAPVALLAPTPIEGIANAKAIVGGGTYWDDPHVFCAVLADDSLSCWGDGQLGAGWDSAHAVVPVRADALTGAASIALGAAHLCNIEPGGTVSCLGSTLDGRLGDGTNEPGASSVPVSVSGLSGAVDLAAGTNHTCALLADGTVSCWGDNLYGQLGDNSTLDRPEPVSAVGLTGVTALSLGSKHSCALKLDGTVYCWGDNFNAQLGTGDTSDQHVPVPVIGLSDVVSIAAGKQHSCAALSDGSVECWGVWIAGTVGLPSRVGYTPQLVPGVNQAIEVVAGALHSCALLESGGVACWGRNDDGQLGDGTTSQRIDPAPVVGLTDAIQLVAAGSTTCALRASGQVVCWGANDVGQIGNGSFVNQPAPTPVPSLFESERVVLGPDLGCARSVTGITRCWGQNLNNFLGFVWKDLLPRVVFGIPCRSCADIALSLSDLGSTIGTAQLELSVANRGASEVDAATLTVLRAEGLQSISWSCDAGGGVCSPASGTGLPVTTLNVLGRESANILMEGEARSGSLFAILSLRVEIPEDAANRSLADDIVHVAIPLSPDAVFQGGFE